ncbi:DUF7162 family protein, partial [Mycolicibacterium sp.]
AHVDLDGLRGVADRLAAAADDIDDIRWPELESGALPGSAVSAAVRPGWPAGPVGELAASLRDWAAAARSSADAFERTDSANGDRFAPR